MKKHFLTLIISFFLWNYCNCQNSKINENNVNKYCDINKMRIAINGTDTLYLMPFELLSIVSFNDIEFSQTDESIFFSFNELLTNENFNFSNGLNDFKINKNEINENDDGIKKWTGNIIKIKLKTIEGDLIREIEKDQKYKLIYCFISDSKTHRTNIPTEHYDGYYIVDIVKINEVFPRQIPYSNN